MTASPQRTTRRVMVVLVASLAIALLPFASANPAAAAPTAPTAPASIASDFVQQINSLRAGRGLSTLAVSSELTAMASSWTQQMAAAGDIWHNPNLGDSVSGWTLIGENVGQGFDVPGLMQAFINSPGHYRNLVEPSWTHVGVGVVQGADGFLYTTHNFMAAEGGAAPAPAAPQAVAAPKPVDRAPRATSAPAPTTTTTTAPAPPPPPPPPEPNGTPERAALVLESLRSFEVV